MTFHLKGPLLCAKVRNLKTIEDLRTIAHSRNCPESPPGGIGGPQNVPQPMYQTASGRFSPARNCLK
eukprot:6699715-Alexandrium_andersonii.AAC.1